MHLKLYEGYVKTANQLTAKIGEMLKDGRIDQEEMPAYSALTRRLGFEYNGMVLHEYHSLATGCAVLIDCRPFGSLGSSDKARVRDRLV